jgi:hypothetical protein
MVTATYSEVDLGIAIYNPRQAEGIPYETLFRDETVGALYAVNGKEYVRMLRRAMDLGGFHQVIFIRFFNQMTVEDRSLLISLARDIVKREKIR